MSPDCMLLCLRRCNGIVFIHVLLLLVFFRFNDETNVVQSFQPVVLIRNQFRQEPKQKSFNIFNHNHIYQRRQQTSLSAEAPFTENDGNNNANDMDNESMIQWELFQKYHAKGSWKGTWTTYDYLGDVQLETIASVNYEHDNDNTIRQSHTIVVGATQSDCETCFDSMETKDMPVATYTPNDMKKSRLGACGMVNGPSLLRNGAMATELVLSHGDGRIRVIFQHAPVWEKGIEPGSCPPQGLQLFRTLISREALRSTIPTYEGERKSPPGDGNPIFFRSVPPFNWHKKWSGTSWTWGVQSGNRGWQLEELGDEDSWHGSAPTELWNLRFPQGGIFVQAPRVVTNTNICDQFRIAWLSNDDTLLRLDAGIVALNPMASDDSDAFVGFEPPSLVSYRCDILTKVGDLEGQPSFVEMSNTPAADSLTSTDAWQ